jgi:hypothetical protein
MEKGEEFQKYGQSMKGNMEEKGGKEAGIKTGYAK